LISKTKRKGVGGKLFPKWVWAIAQLRRKLRREKMFVLRDLAILLAGLFIGFTFATMILYPQLENRYKMGQKNGSISGGLRVVRFLEKQFPKAGRANRSVPLEALSVKSRTIEVYEINGVRSLQVR